MPASLSPNTHYYKQSRNHQAHKIVTYVDLNRVNILIPKNWKIAAYLLAAKKSIECIKESKIKTIVSEHIQIAYWNLTQKFHHCYLIGVPSFSY